MSNRVQVYFADGVESGTSLAAFISAAAKAKTPMLSWAEPEASFTRGLGRGRISNFTPLMVGLPDWPEDVPIVEARLFWPGSALHVVAGENGCRWARISEAPDAGEAKEVIRSKTPVLPLKDASRFGLPKNTHWLSSTLAAYEYHADGRLIAWRLETE